MLYPVHANDAPYETEHITWESEENLLMLNGMSGWKLNEVVLVHICRHSCTSLFDGVHSCVSYNESVRY